LFLQDICIGAVEGRIYSSIGLLTSSSLLAESFYSLQTNTNVMMLKGFLSKFAPD